MDTAAIDFLINNPPSPSPSPSPPSHISTIFSNWPNTPHILPSNIRHELTEPLLPALANLSNFTVNQPERAWNLLNTYYQCRIREARGSVEILEVEDVEKAIGSARRMSVGHDMESVRGRYSVGEELGGRKGRKWSIKDEICRGAPHSEQDSKRTWSRDESLNERDVKRQKTEEVDVSLVLDFPSPLTALPPLFALLNDDDTFPIPAISSFPHRTLPPITPLSNTLPWPPLTMTIPHTPESNLPGNTYPSAEDRVRSYQEATHEAHLSRQELENAEENLHAARMRYADAQRKYGEAKRAAKRLRV
jgi:hypothetical protein